MRLSGTDVELVCEIQISTETVRHEHDGCDEAPPPSFRTRLVVDECGSRIIDTHAPLFSLSHDHVQKGIDGSDDPLCSLVAR